MNDTDPLPPITAPDFEAATSANPSADAVDLAPIDFERIAILAPATPPEARPEAAASPVRRSVDARGSSAPLALLRLHQALGEIAGGEALLFQADCPGIASDLAAVARVAAVIVTPTGVPDNYRIGKP